MPPFFPLDVRRRTVDWFVSDDDGDAWRAARVVLSAAAAAAAALSVVGTAWVHLDRRGLVVGFKA